jgi:hypothetical protein
MTMLTKSSLALRVLFLALGLLGASCAKKATEEDQVRKVIDEGVAALEARDSARAAETLAEDYSDARGRTRDKLKRIAFFVLQQGPVLVRLSDVQIKVEGKSATATIKALAMQGSGELKTAADLLPTNARAFDLTLRFSKESGDWLVTALDGDNAPSWE